MAALLVALAVMAVMMSAVLPAWRHQAKREKEAELAFRGEQYVRAIGLWERKMGPGSRPPNFDVLVQQRFLRKKYKDPMVADGEFLPLFAGMNPQAPTQPGGGRGGASPPGAGRGATMQGGRGGAQMQPPMAGPGGQSTGGGILGVVSKSKEASIRIYNGASHYNEWRFLYAGAATAPGGRGNATPGGDGRGRPGDPTGRGGFPAPGRGIGPGGRGPGGRGGGGFPPPVAPGRGRGQ
jgi:hypothetical protein